MSRKRVLLLGVLIALLLAGGIIYATIGERVPEKPIERPVAEVIAEPTIPEEKPAKEVEEKVVVQEPSIEEPDPADPAPGTFENPVLFGQPFVYPGLGQKLTILDAKKLFPHFIEVIVEIQAIGSPGQIIEWSGLDFKLVGKKGKISKETPFIGGEILAGSKTVAELGFRVDEDDSEFLLIWNPFIRGTINYFFEVPTPAE